MSDPVSAAVLGALLRQFMQGSISELQYHRHYKGRQIRIITDKQLVTDGGSTTKEHLSILDGEIDDVLDTPPAFIIKGEEYTIRRVHSRVHDGTIDSFEQQITASQSCEKSIPLDTIEEFKLESDEE